MKRGALLRTTSIAIALSAMAPFAAHAKTPLVRVAMQHGVKRIALAGESILLTNAEGDGVVAPATELELTLTTSGVQVDSQGVTLPLAHDHLIATAAQGTNTQFLVGGAQVKGRIHIWREPSGLLLVNELDLETYVSGLINYEISSKWPIEAVKAQTVAARTYALHQIKGAANEKYDVEGTILDQVYKGSALEDARSREATAATAGRVLVDSEGNLVQAFFHSCCGGRTELPENVWGKATQLRKIVQDRFCKNAPNFNWTWTAEPNELGAKLKAAGHPGGFVTRIKVDARTESHRAQKVEIETTEGKVVMNGNDLRKIVGYTTIPSAQFRVTAENGKFTFVGTGSGHGVGMCQWGAKGMGDGNYNYRQILGHYYPGLFIRRVYSVNVEPST